MIHVGIYSGDLLIGAAAMSVVPVVGDELSLFLYSNLAGKQRNLFPPFASDTLWRITKRRLDAHNTWSFEAVRNQQWNLPSGVCNLTVEPLDEHARAWIELLQKKED